MFLCMRPVEHPTNQQSNLLKVPQINSVFGIIGYFEKCYVPFKRFGERVGILACAAQNAIV